MNLDLFSVVADLGLVDLVQRMALGRVLLTKETIESSQAMKERSHDASLLNINTHSYS